ncbi:MAG TPA: FAD-dependent oxidoreductase [Isosphaeraceae bacterium]|jgi:2-polyprenyl-6-methoxyphenol hydroxylase-like FAD-dependent oxidoreductase|nr:FAD-dependent oxidoreductase [Isosphaeraceae bacterium]
MPGEGDRGPEVVRTRCCVTGGGPAGMMLGFLLARAGVEVVVLEKHGDFLRDFRGDTIHPSTLELMYELGILDEFLKRPHDEAREIHGVVGDQEIPVADFTHVPTHCKFLAFMPQWDFLDFLAEHARKLPAFALRMKAEVTDLIEEDGRVVGVRATTPDAPLEVRAALTVGADGRHSTVRARAGLEVEDIGAPIDVLWMRLPRRPDDPVQSLGRFDRGRILVMIQRDTYWQCAFVIHKGGFDAIRAQGLDHFRDQIGAIAPVLKGRTDALKSWDDVKLLTVTVDRLKAWSRPGLLCIGDAAHAMSPIGGVGINLAIQDAVAAANLLARPLRDGDVSPDDLDKVRRRRLLPTRLTQRLQVLIQDRILGRVLDDPKPLSVPWQLRLLRRFPFLRRIPARIIGVGFRPEHVKTPRV